MDQSASQGVFRTKDARIGHQVARDVQAFRRITGVLGDDPGVKLQVVVEAHRIFRHPRMVHRAMQGPVERMEQELAVGTGAASLAGEEQDVAHRLDGTQVVGMYRHRQRAQEVVQGKAVAAFPAHGGDVDPQLLGLLLQDLGASVDQIAAGGRIDRPGEMDDVLLGHARLSFRIGSSTVCNAFPTEDCRTSAVSHRRDEWHPGSEGLRSSPASTTQRACSGLRGPVSSATHPAE